MSPTQGLRFDIDGNSPGRLTPLFKIWRWHSTDPYATAQLEGTSLTAGVDYLAAVKPVSRAHFADQILFHTSLQSAAAVTSPDIGDGTGAVISGVVPATARYGAGAQFNATTDQIDIPLVGQGDGRQNLELDRGRIEFWYQPTYNHDDNVAHYLFDVTNLANCRIRGQSIVITSGVSIRMGPIGHLPTAAFVF